MQVGISRISETREQADEVLSASRRHGFEGVQLKPSQYSEFIESPKIFEEHYGQLASLAQGGLVFYPGNDPILWVEKVGKVLPFAAAVGAGHICLCSGVYSSGASNEEVKTTAEALTTLGREARQLDLQISIHNHVDSLVETEEDIARLLEVLNPEVCGLTLDTAHAAKAGIEDVARLVERFQKHLLNVHLKDLTAEGEFCALGQGVLAIDPILEKLHAIGYDQWLIVDEETKALDTEAAFKIAADYLKQRNILN